MIGWYFNWPPMFRRSKRFKDFFAKAERNVKGSNIWQMRNILTNFNNSKHEPSKISRNNGKNYFNTTLVFALLVPHLRTYCQQSEKNSMKRILPKVIALFLFHRCIKNLFSGALFIWVMNALNHVKSEKYHGVHWPIMMFAGSKIRQAAANATCT